MRRIGLVIFDGVTALDVVGPAEALAAARVDDHAVYEVVTLGPTTRACASESGITLKPDHAFETAPALDTLIVPGGSGLRRPGVADRLAGWIKDRASRVRRIASVCTGIYGLAPSGLLDGRRVTTHWRFAQDVATRFPRLEVDADALYIKDGRYYTSAGITAAIDLTLALIGEDHGTRVALAVARELVVYLKRDGGQEQFSEPLQFQLDSADRLGDLAAWMVGHLDQDLSVEALAHRAAVSPRHFSRRFKAAFRRSPAAFVEALRLDEARRRLTARATNIDGVADSVGFRSADVFRRAFARRFGISPADYRERFEPGAVRR
jgi:transcriptional regulator GlxA family with amidase domain